MARFTLPPPLSQTAQPPLSPPAQEPPQPQPQLPHKLDFQDQTCRPRGVRGRVGCLQFSLLPWRARGRRPCLRGKEPKRADNFQRESESEGLLQRSGPRKCLSARSQWWCFHRDGGAPEKEMTRVANSHYLTHHRHPHPDFERSTDFISRGL